MLIQLLYEVMNYGSLVLIVGAIAVGAVLTQEAVRKLLVAALIVTVLRFLLSMVFPGWLHIANEATAFAYGLVQTLLSVGEVVLLVGAAVVGARTIRTKDAALAALADEPTDAWRQPEGSPDPRLLAD